MKLLAAAFPRASWRVESDAAYTLALVNSGLPVEDIARAVAWCTANLDQLPTVSRIIAAARSTQDSRLICFICGHEVTADDMEEAFWREGQGWRHKGCVA